jgi:hypothetical protein
MRTRFSTISPHSMQSYGALCLCVLISNIHLIILQQSKGSTTSDTCTCMAISIRFIDTNYNRMSCCYTYVLFYHLQTHISYRRIHTQRCACEQRSTTTYLERTTTMCLLHVPFIRTITNRMDENS